MSLLKHRGKNIYACRIEGCALSRDFQFTGMCPLKGCALQGFKDVPFEGMRCAFHDTGMRFLKPWGRNPSITQGCVRSRDVPFRIFTLAELKGDGMPFQGIFILQGCAL